MEEQRKLHIVMVPWLAFGHMIPYLELAKCLAQMGHRVSFLSTPRNIDRLPSIPHDLRPRINLVKLTPPPVVGLPEDAQSTVDVPLDHINYLLELLDGLEGPLSSFLDGDSSPDWMIYDVFFYWAPRVAARYGIPTVFFGPFSAMTLSIMGPPSLMMDSQPTTPEQLLVPPPWVPFPTNVTYRYYEAVRIANGRSRRASGSGLTARHRTGITFQGCHVVAIRSCLEFEPEWIPLLGELYEKPVFPVGLLSPSIPEIDDMGHDTWVNQEWLDTQKHESTVYVAFGSELRFSKEQMHELAIGLELSELPFFWAYRGDPSLLPPGFEERTKARGIVRLGWAPQARLLAHTSIGCFLVHGGWGSSIEGLAFGKPLVMLPFIGDQGLITCVMKEKKVGVEVARNDRDGSFTREAVTESLKLMMGDEGGPIRSNAKELMKIFADKERHDQYIKDFADYLIEHRRRDGVPTPSA
ncbi:UDP-glycosyltransferase 91A1-like [Magnolia sinica]|uniref:UDP-glycosyltransferase 91A1-like n=1 Tax=Magnolia sinica TaxID=86752 RepID=UPI00265A7F31|nr:UDP-glycosyltransferase 91A1-like [Magnolia sinica]